MFPYNRAHHIQHSPTHKFPKNRQDTAPPKQESHLLDLLDISLGATSISSPTQDAWGMQRGQPPAILDPWAAGGSNALAVALDPWHSSGGAGGSGGRPPLAAIGGGAGAADVENWLSRTQSPSSGSSAEGAWLQNGGGGGGGNSTTLTNGGGVTDPWLSGRPAAAAAPVDPWLNKAQEASVVDPWQSPNLNNGHAAAAAAQPPPAGAAPVLGDPWSASMGSRPSPIGAQMSPNSDLDEFDVITNRSKTNAATNNNNCECS